MPIDRRMDNEDVVHIYNGIALSHKKEWNNVICSNMDGPRQYHIKWRQRNTNVIWYFLYLESKKIIQMNLYAKQKQTHRYRKQIYGYQSGKGGVEIN